ncbi:hypothetical protein PPERSA_08248 [Pseudocohnilembus persalinus]|uniref:Uncharacterized protein n=1 Tax=Pseudocohnilembus persalinus TaxID=266149 RepID=A0A0V0QG14_PSEPJ|nr:hypothetical protein PPERSA_08248 [Pseudocohnilembus persalinus]|eukprot:KRX01147.1 hypothetical protein PPERSA_08248 [Pseudocohnilembus persalinus]
MTKKKTQDIKNTKSFDTLISSNQNDLDQQLKLYSEHSQNQNDLYPFEGAQNKQQTPAFFSNNPIEIQANFKQDYDQFLYQQSFQQQNNFPFSVQEQKNNITQTEQDTTQGNNDDIYKDEKSSGIYQELLELQQNISYDEEKDIQQALIESLNEINHQINYNLLISNTTPGQNDYLIKNDQVTPENENQFGELYCDQFQDQSESKQAKPMTQQEYFYQQLQNNRNQDNNIDVEQYSLFQQNQSQYLANNQNDQYLNQVILKQNNFKFMENGSSSINQYELMQNMTQQQSKPTKYFFFDSPQQKANEYNYNDQQSRYFYFNNVQLQKNDEEEQYQNNMEIKNSNQNKPETNQNINILSEINNKDLVSQELIKNPNLTKLQKKTKLCQSTNQQVNLVEQEDLQKFQFQNKSTSFLENQQSDIPVQEFQQLSQINDEYISFHRANIQELLQILLLYKSLNAKQQWIAGDFSKNIITHKLLKHWFPELNYKQRISKYQDLSEMDGKNTIKKFESMLIQQNDPQKILDFIIDLKEEIELPIETQSLAYYPFEQDYDKDQKYQKSNECNKNGKKRGIYNKQGRNAEIERFQNNISRKISCFIAFELLFKIFGKTYFQGMSEQYIESTKIKKYNFPNDIVVFRELNIQQQQKILKENRNEIIRKTQRYQQLQKQIKQEKLLKKQFLQKLQAQYASQFIQTQIQNDSQQCRQFDNYEDQIQNFQNYEFQKESQK